MSDDRHSCPPLFPPTAGDRPPAASPFLPMSADEMAELGWDACDVVLVTGDAYVDHPSFGMALIGRLLEASGYRVGILAQPDWHSADPFRALGRPRLMFAVTAGNMDSMVNRYTAERKVRRQDAYSPDGEPGRRPDRATIVYAHRCREAFPGVPIVVGGIEASLRRVAHYDYWSDKVRRSLLFDARADLLLYGSAERAVVATAHRLARGVPVASIRDLRGTAFAAGAAPADWRAIDMSDPDHRSGRLGSAATRALGQTERPAVRIPSYERAAADPVLFAHAARVLQREANPAGGRPILQAHGDRELCVNPPPLPLTTAELDQVYELPYARAPHPSYADRQIPAHAMIRFSVPIVRGCAGGCAFCAIAAHEGQVLQSRSLPSILREIERIRDRAPGFTGTISDLGGPTANLYRCHCTEPALQAVCRRSSCLYPRPCRHFATDHRPLIELYRRARAVPGVRKVLVASGIRHDLAIDAPDYIAELARHHVGGHLKIAPEHLAARPLAAMRKPAAPSFYRFRDLFARASARAGKQQYLLPYFIAAHPGTTDADMLELALELRRENIRVDQVQAFLPAPMTAATAAYVSGRDPHRPLRGGGAPIYVPRGERQRRLHKAFLRYHDPDSWPILRSALRAMGRADLIGSRADQLVPDETRPRSRASRRRTTRPSRRRDKRRSKR